MISLAGPLGAKASAMLKALSDPAGRQRFIDEGAVLFSRGFMVLVSIVTSAVTARLLGPTLRGDYFYGIATGITIAQFAGMALPSANLYFAAKESEKVRVMMVGTILLAFLGCGVFTGVFFVLTASSPFVAWRAPIGWQLVFALGMTQMLTNSVPVFLAGTQRYVEMSVAQVITGLLSVIAILAAARYAPRLEVFTLVVIGSNMIMPLLTFARLWPQLHGHGTWVDTPFLRHWITFALRAVPSVLLSYLLARGTVYSAKAVLLPEAFGVFSIAYQIFEALLNLPQTIGMVMYPKIVRSEGFSSHVLVKECLRSAAICAVFGAVAIAVINPVLPLVFGKVYQPAAAMLIWYLPALVALGVCTIANQFLAAMAFPLTANLAWAVSGAVSVACTYVGGRLFGGTGVAAGTSLGWCVAAMIFLTAVHYEIRLRQASVAKP